MSCPTQRCRRNPPAADLQVSLCCFPEPAREWLCPLQVGVAVPLGVKATVHTARQWVQRRSGHATDVFLKVDFNNAFNTVDRAAPS